MSVEDYIREIMKETAIFEEIVCLYVCGGYIGVFRKEVFECMTVCAVEK